MLIQVGPAAESIVFAYSLQRDRLNRVEGAVVIGVFACELVK
jgi:hypothetical protein